MSKEALTGSLLALTALLASCGGPADPACWSTGSCEGGETCRDVADCRSGVCSAGVCEDYCDASSECGAGSACIREHGLEGTTQTCRSECEDGAIVDAPDASAMVCQGGALTTCDAVADPGSVCDVCGCPAGDVCDSLGFLRCDELGGLGCRCLTPQPLGGPCTSHLECVSRNCSGRAESTGPRRCQPARGEACTTENCEFCNLPTGSGTFGCRQTCAGASDCPGGLCLGFADRQEYACYTECTDDASVCFIDESCEYVTGDSSFRRVCRPN